MFSVTSTQNSFLDGISLNLINICSLPLTACLFINLYRNTFLGPRIFNNLPASLLQNGACSLLLLSTLDSSSSPNEPVAAQQCCPDLDVAPPSWRLLCRLEASVTAQIRAAPTQRLSGNCRPDREWAACSGVKVARAVAYAAPGGAFRKQFPKDR